MKFLNRWLIATIAGAVTMFVWGGFSHLVLLKGIGFTRIPNEDRIVSTLRSSLPADGFYNFLGIDLRSTPSEKEKANWEAKFQTGPTGMILYHTSCDTPVSPRKLSVQFLSNVLTAGILAYVVSFTAISTGRRVWLAAL